MSGPGQEAVKSVGVLFLAITLMGCSECRRELQAPNIPAEVFSTEITPIPSALPAGYSVESSILNMGDASDIFARQPSLGSAISSDLARVWAAEKNILGDHLVIVFKIYGARSAGGSITVYSDVYYQWWTATAEGVSEGSGRHLPVRIRLRSTAGTLSISGYDAPGDGNLFTPGVRDLFPEPYASQILKAQDGARDLLDENRRLAGAWAVRRHHQSGLFRR